uniref:Progonadoliberin-1 n=1 Tax=Labrus bergylta TaxID=56723 RepID=A0A3Q3LLI8_9LABR
LHRMVTPSPLWLLLVCTAIPFGCSQHWSYGLSPGGKRELDNLSDTLNNIVEGFPHVGPACCVLGCEEESPFSEMRKRGLLDIITSRESGHKKYKK